MTITRNRMPYPIGVVPQFQGQIPTASGSNLDCPITIITSASFVNAATIVTNGYSVSHTGAASAGTTSMTLGGSLTTAGVGRPDYARNVVITVTHSSAIVAIGGTITGTDIYGRVITEAWSITAGGTSKTFTGKKAFKTITSITETVAADASTDTIIAGSGKVLGLPFKAASVNLIAETQDGALPTAGVIVAASSVSTDDFLGTYTPNATLDGAKDFKVWYLVEDITVQP